MRSLRCALITVQFACSAAGIRHPLRSLPVSLPLPPMWYLALLFLHSAALGVWTRSCRVRSFRCHLHPPLIDFRLKLADWFPSRLTWHLRWNIKISRDLYATGSGVIITDFARVFCCVHWNVTFYHMLCQSATSCSCSVVLSPISCAYSSCVSCVRM